MHDGHVRTRPTTPVASRAASQRRDDCFRVAFKPTATIMREQQTVTPPARHQLAARGRHDPCVLPRAVPIVEAMAALVLADHALRQRSIS